MQPAVMRRAFWVLNKFFMLPMIRLGLLPFMGTPVGGWMMMLTTTGRRSGGSRQTPLLGIPYHGAIILIASSFGRRPHPGWYYNLRADPHAQVCINGQAYQCQARLTSGAERDALFETAAEYYPGYLDYQQRAAPREIGVFLLEITNPLTNTPPNAPGAPPAGEGQPGSSEPLPTGSAGGSGSRRAG